MATFKDLQDRIALDYLNRMTLMPEVKRAINNSIKTYEARRYWFNEAQTAMATTSGQLYMSVPSDFLILDRLEARIGGSLSTLRETDFHSIRDLNAGEATGSPCEYAYHGDRFELYPIPDAIYTVNVYYIKSLPALTADSDSNVWTNEAANLIAHAATVDLLCGVLQADSASISRHVSMLQIAQNELNLRNTTRLSRSLKPTRF